MSAYHKNLGTDFGYNIVELSLYGELDGVTFHARAVSGGRAGSKTAGAVNPILANNPYLTGVKKSGQVPGGPLVMGTYTMRTHEDKAKRKDYIRLEPCAGTDMNGRSGMLIHGRGERGSDGCIVPTDFNVVTELYRLLAAREAQGKPAPTLAVYSIGDLEHLDKQLDALLRTV